MKVFLGGTNGNWREQIIPKLKCKYFNPEIDEWTEECQKIDEEQKKICDYHLYVVTPDNNSVLLVAEAVNDSKDIKEHCIFCILKDNKKYSKKQLAKLEASVKIIVDNGGTICNTLDDIIEFLNNKAFFELEEQLKYYKKWSNFVSEHYNKLVNEIIPKGWYSESINDSWQGVEEEYKECLNRLNRAFVKKILKY